MAARTSASSRAPGCTVRKPTAAAVAGAGAVVARPSAAGATGGFASAGSTATLSGAASSSLSAAGPSSKPTAKRRRKTSEEDGSASAATGGDAAGKPKKKKAKPAVNGKPEKRHKLFRKKCPKALLERIARAVQQRMYLVERHKRSDVEEEFAVLGSTGNVYTVEISHIPKCTCPDFTKGNLCKHIFFVYLKVLRLSRDSPLIYQAGLLTSELCAIFAEAIPDPAAVANETVRDHYKRLKGGGQPGDDSNRKQVEGDCPICYEALDRAEKMVWCRVCGNNIHGECFEQWKRNRLASRSDVTCVYCRACWADSSVLGVFSNADVGEGYVNLRTVAGLPEERDTSTYSDWYSRGRW